jgi:hypothetical protein
MRGVSLCALGLVGSGVLGAQVAQPNTQARDAAQPPSWVGRLDPAAEKGGAKITENTLLESTDGMRVTTGASAVYWHPGNTGAGAYTVRASFAQTRSSLAEFYGLFMGGSQLQKGAQNYLYCAVAGNGTFAVRHVNGNEVSELAGRTASPAVRRANAEGQATNVVALRVTADRTTCLVNGTEVWGYATRSLVGPGKLLSTDGLAGIRVNRALDVQVTGFTITSG